MINAWDYPSMQRGVCFGGRVQKAVSPVVRELHLCRSDNSTDSRQSPIQTFCYAALLRLVCRRGVHIDSTVPKELE